MKTILQFDESVDKRLVILKHKKEVKIYKDTRKDHIQWEDMKKNVIQLQNYIVINFPKEMDVDWKILSFSKEDTYSIGYLVRELEDEVEMLLYDRITFCWNLYDLEKAGLFKVSQRIIPDKEEGELFHLYLNPRTLKEYTYDILFSLIQLPYQMFKQHKHKNKYQH